MSEVNPDSISIERANEIIDINYIDVSHFDSQIQLHQAKIEHPELVGVIAKATQGSDCFDSCFDGFRRRAQEVGLKFSAYHFLTDDNIESGDSLDQWRNFEQKLGDRSDIDMIVLDVEQNDLISDWNIFHEMRLFKTVNFLLDMLKTGHRSCLYMDEDYWLNFWPEVETELEDQASQVIRWVAKYSDEPPTCEWDLWQFSDSLTIGGNRNTDCNTVNPNGRLK